MLPHEDVSWRSCHVSAGAAVERSSEIVEHVEDDHSILIGIGHVAIADATVRTFIS